MPVGASCAAISTRGKCLSPTPDAILKTGAKTFADVPMLYTDGLSSEQLGDAHFHTYTLARMSSLWESLSLSKFSCRFQLLYGLLLERRSLYHRIRLLRLRNHISRPRMGQEFQQDTSGHLRLNRRTQARTKDMQRIRERHPWLSLEDWNLFLVGWGAGWESGRLADIPENSEPPHNVP
jgi:hypothetical protein